MKQKQLDNSYLADKIALRINNIPKKEMLSVLDAYHGGGSIWKNIQKKYKGQIKILKMDKEQKDNCFVLLGDNQKYFDSIDLNKFDVIDLNAYGVPYEQLKTIFDKKYRGIVFVTFIQTMTGMLPYGFLEELGYTKEMIKKVPSLFCKDGFKKMCYYLKKNGIEKILYRQKNRKNYLCFSTN